MPKFNNVELTDATIKATREHFAANAHACIYEVDQGYVKLPSHTKHEDYFSQQYQRAADSLAGKNDHTFTFLQRAYWIQAGEMVALLPKSEKLI